MSIETGQRAAQRTPALGVAVLVFVLGLFWGVGVHAQAPLQPLLHDLFQDHAVLQRDRPIAVWGQAASFETVTVSLGAASVSVRADPSGQWRAELPALSAGGPFVLTAQGSSGARQSASDILVGDVFLCSGQSNMELPVAQAGDSSHEIEHAANDTIRMLTVAHASSPLPQAMFSSPVSWQRATAKSVPGWSATCWFFARELQKTVHVPIGLIHASWGGANLRPWLSAAAVEALGGYDSALSLLREYAHDQAGAQRRFAAEWEDWWRSKSPRPLRPPAVRRTATPWQPGSPGWLGAPSGLGNWQSWGKPELETFNGLVWYRTHFALTAAQAQSATRLDLGPINQVDQTWLNGTSVGNTFGYGTDRSYELPRGLLHAGDNVLVVNVLSTYEGGGLLNGATPRAIRFSGGGEQRLSGPWEYQVAPPEVGYPPRAPWESVGGLTTLYNGMIAPLGSYGLRGVVWYQGESNVADGAAYQTLLASLMSDWRRQFASAGAADGELPFLIVQLPNYGTPSIRPGESEWAAIREAQRLAVSHDRHAGLAVTIDIGEPRNLHPTNKQDVGKRLARAARRVIYGETIPASGPTPRRARLNGSSVGVDVADVEEGLVAYSHTGPIGFELCDDSPGSCRFVAARIDGNTVQLTVPLDSRPTRVRYCWADSPVCTLFDAAGAPAGPFELPIDKE